MGRCCGHDVSDWTRAVLKICISTYCLRQLPFNVQEECDGKEPEIHGYLLLTDRLSKI